MNNLANSPGGQILNSPSRMASQDAGDARHRSGAGKRAMRDSDTAVCTPRGGITLQADNPPRRTGSADSVSCEAIQ